MDTKYGTPGINNFVESTSFNKNTDSFEEHWIAVTDFCSYQTNHTSCKKIKRARRVERGGAKYAEAKAKKQEKLKEEEARKYAEAKVSELNTMK